MNPASQGQGNPHLGGPMSQHQMQGQPPMQQRVYEQARFAPTVTQEMRVRARMQAPQQRVSDTPWTGAVRQSQPVEEPGSTANIIRLAIAIVAVVGLTIGLAVLALVGSLSFGVRLFALIALSAIPLIGIIAYVLWLDRWKPQPKIVLGLCLLWGGVAAVILTLVFSLVSQVALYFAGVGAMPDAVGAVIQAPIVEETTKTVLLVVIVLAARRHFEGPLDGLVYGALIGAGFAFTENVLYLGGAWEEAAAAGLWQTFVLRCLFSPLLHTVFCTCAGVTIGFAARKWQWWAIILMWLPGLFVGMILHGIWNGTMTGLSLLGTIPQIIGLIVLSFILTTCWVVLGILLRRSERLHTLNMLGDYANTGWFTHAEVDMLGTWKGRKFGRQWANSFPGGKEEMRTMIRTSGDLSTTRMRLLAGVGGQKERDIESFQLKKFSSARDRLLAASRSVIR
ncbi:Membrane proteinase PrsW, cleaves anti-sigma factor RsiW, M82 family [Brevibacterium sandarakinum]|uniref:Membrane proteinase PrsW, cleaves anti-sigma factor RsiW, M82 family n=3 Tax=Brevibacterium TaxID=1696 RepID=A0A1H1NCM3_BRESA|nr:PrsW family intramembrane metalloprotease [Brevibacterium sandarakinum]SDR96704.1 Membrane proteinase PrsW, cleaves anti-sigma factor RsiW, M82 family [Brevibacterium sandarakinum]